MPTCKTTSRLAMTLLCIMGLAPVIPTIASPSLENAAHPPRQFTDAHNVELVGHIGGATYTVAMQGNYAYIGVGPRLVILDISNPASPTVVGETSPLPGIVRDVVVSGIHAYVNVGGAGMRVVDVSTPSNPKEVGFYDAPGDAKGIAIAGDYAYVVSGLQGLQIVDISTSFDPTEVGSYDTAGSAQGVAVAGSYAYVTDGNEGLRVVDISTPANPTEVGHALEAASGNVTIDGNYAYVANLAGLRIVDISTPTDPTELGAYDTPGTASDVVIAGGYAYIADEDGGLRIVDISEPSSPVEVGSYDIQGNVEDVAVAGAYAYVADKDGGLRVVDVSTPAGPTEVGSYDTPGFVNDVAIVDDLAYVAAGSDGLWVVDVSTIFNPKEVGSHDTPGIASKITVAADDPQDHTYAYVADGEGGVRIVDVSMPTHPREVGFYDTPGSTSDVAVAGGYAYIGDYSYDSYSHGLQVVDISAPAHPKEAGYYRVRGAIKAVAVAPGAPQGHTYAYVAAYDWGVNVVDITNPHNPVAVGVFSTAGWNVDIAVAEGALQGHTYAYVAARENGLQVVDVSVPSNPRAVGNALDSATGVAVDQGLAYVVTGGFIALRTGLRVVDVSAPSDLTEVGFYDTPGAASGIDAANGYSYVADGAGGLLVLRYVGEGGAAKPADTPVPTVVPTVEVKVEPASSVVPPALPGPRENGEWIAFVGQDRNIWLVHPDGSGLRQITTDAVVEYDRGVEKRISAYYDPEWSPAGDRLLFIKRPQRGRGGALMVFEPEANEARVLIPSIESSFDWASDGSRIIYGKGFSDLLAMDLFSGQENLLVASRNELTITNPKWSPDGKHIAFGEMHPTWDIAALFDLSIVNLESNDAYVSLEGIYFTDECDWSPNGARLVCADPPDHTFHGPCQLSEFDVRGTLVAEFPAEPLTCDLSPMWSYDGRYIAVEAHVQGWEGDEYISRRSFTDILSPDGTERRRIATGVPVGWSPDSQWLLVVDDEETISRVEIDTGETVVIGEGYDADWKPQPVPPPSLDDLLAAKRSAIPQLERTAYGSARVPIDAYDESAAEALLAELELADPDTMAPEQLAALSRLVLQEQALAQTLADYSVLSDDFTDTQVDIAGLYWSTYFLLMKAGLAPGTLIHDLIDKTLWDIATFGALGISDGKTRELAYNGIALASDVLSSLEGDPAAVFEAFVAEDIRTQAAKENVAMLVSHVQPTIDQGVCSASDACGEAWPVEGTDWMATSQLGHITTTSQIRQETAHSQYQQLAEGLAVNEIMKDATDLVSVGTGSLPIPKLFSLWTRIQQALVDLWAQAILGNSMTCIRQVSARAGELAFQPGQLMATCEDPTSATIPWIDDVAWLALQLRLERDLADYEVAVQAVQEAVQGGDQEQAHGAIDQLATVQSDLSASSQVALALLTPPAGETWTAETGTIARQIAELELNMAGLQLGLAGYLAEPDSQEVRDYVDLYAQRLLEGTPEAQGQAGETWRVFLPLVTRRAGELSETGPASRPSVEVTDAANLADNVRRFGQMLERGDLAANAVSVPQITDAPVELEGTVGQSLTITVHVQNVGSATLDGATLTASAGETVLDTLDVPAVDAGQSVELALSFTPSAESRSMLALELDDGARTDWRLIPLAVQAASQPTPPPPPTTTVPAEGGEPQQETPEPASAGGRSPAILIVAILAAILTVMLGVLALRQLRSCRACPNCGFDGNPPKAAYCIECGTPLPRRSPALLIGWSASALILVATIVLWQIGLPGERAEESATPTMGSAATPTAAPSLVAEGTAPADETIVATAPSPIQTPTPPSLSGQSPIASPTPARDAPASPTESPSSCPVAPPQQVQVGDSARVCTAHDQLVVRTQPRRGSTEVTRLEPGTRVTIVDGPVCAQDWSWWKVRTDAGKIGWVAEGGDEVDPYFICPAD